MALNKLAVFDFSEIENMTFFLPDIKKLKKKKQKPSLYFLSSQFTILKTYKVNNKYFMFFFFLTGVIIILKKNGITAAKFKLY